MKGIKLICVFVIVLFRQTSAQHPVASFILPEDPYTACIDEILDVQNTSTGASAFLWDFCPELFTEFPVKMPPLPVEGLINGWAYKVVEDSGEWFGFLASRNTNTLYRLEFGQDPNSNPTIFNLGNPGNLLVTPQGIDIANHAGNWYLFLGKGETTVGQVVRLDFGNDLRNPPVPLGLGTFGINGRIRDLKIVKQNVDLILLLINDSGNAIRRVNYRSSFDNPISPGDITATGPLPGANLPLGMSIVKVNGEWIVHTVSFINNGIQQYNFGSDILGNPMFIGNYSFASVLRPYYIKVIQEGENYYAFVGNESAKMAIINFTDLTNTTPPSAIPNTNFEALVNFDVIKFQSKNIVQGVVQASNFIQFYFENNTCSVSSFFSESENPTEISVGLSGNLGIELEVRGNDGLIDNFFKEISVSTNSAPVIAIEHDNSCLTSLSNFTTSSNQTLVLFEWDFGDMESSPDPDPIHQYASVGDFNVILKVVSSTGCRNLTNKVVSIYNEPIPNFTLPTASPICTNQEYIFTNTSTFDPGSNTSWSWEVNGTPVSTDQELAYSITSTTPQNVKLIASIPGCSNELEQSITTIEEGPLADFTFSDGCEDSVIEFTNATVGDVDEFTWHFGDGTTSNEVNEENTYTTFGDYNVTLEAANLAGCNNSVVKPVKIYSKPQPDFSLDLPPFSCTGSPSQFNDLTPAPTDSNLSGWTWNFGDAGGESSTAQNPQHTYVDAGQYDVSLEVTTNFGCVETVQKEVTISQSPVVNFTLTPACINQPTVFTDASGTDNVAWQWKIGSSMYAQQNPVHVFAVPGNYGVELTVTGENDCIGFASQPVNVPAVPNLNFTTANNCADQGTEFTDTTPPGTDPPVAWQWLFGSLGSASGTPATFSFPDAGSFPAQLTVTTQSGCNYTTSKTVTIEASPVANFIASPQSGTPPLEVEFLNLSVNAMSQSWYVNNSAAAVSEEVSPSLTFDELGSYVVDLTVVNASGCTDTHSEIVSVIVPSLDIELTSLTITELNSGKLNLEVTLTNKSNSVIHNPRIFIDVAGQALLDELIVASIAPGLYHTETLSTGVLGTRNELSYICAEAVISGDVDLTNNKRCVNLDQGLIVFAPFPNPGSDVLNLEWIAESEGSAAVSIFSTTGGNVFFNSFNTYAQGFNTLSIDLTNLNPGLYYVLFVSGNARQSYPFVVRR